MGMKWYLSVVLISTSLMIHDTRHLLMCLLLICILFREIPSQVPLLILKKFYCDIINIEHCISVMYTCADLIYLYTDIQLQL